jgi:hypothetical protein
MPSPGDKVVKTPPKSWMTSINVMGILNRNITWQTPRLFRKQAGYRSKKQGLTHIGLHVTIGYFAPSAM